ncbi:MAG: sulfurtransferase complex subunit TusB [Gammaproteobacteria bacterium]|nr:sulfurtransferase complex subunit TusB [Gammaproteobacteria bacterium]MDP2141183.1 sulfurtransferase complex subunit TusB [Gammaproteobacteria bacterium]MDP2349143.1 sulfurtransferase complex subunit TusB [Gammaproteobacteria bacterium]
MTTLHTVNKFSLTSSALDSCLRVALPGDAILLMEDGVYNAVGASLASDDAGINVETRSTASIGIYALKEDLQARGIAHDSLPSSIEPVSYADFVTLVCTHHKTVSWF